MTNQIKLNDILRLTEEETRISKIKFNQNNGEEDPMEVYLHDPELVNHQWLFWRTKQRYFSVGQIAICFLKLSYDTWLLTTIKLVTKEFDVFNDINYEGVEIERFKGYFGRVIVKYHKKTQGQGYMANTILNELEVLEILTSTFDGEDFKGFDQVCLTFKQLETIVMRRKKDWFAALENQKGVYLIADKNNGMMYVGSAYGSNGMLLDRWKQYIENGHGGNVKLIELIKKQGIEYARENFQFTILENYNSRVESNKIIAREQWWKDALITRRFGYNVN